MSFRSSIAKKFCYIFFVGAFLFVIPVAGRADTIGQTETFNVNSKYDQFSRSSIDTTLRNISDHAYFYVEDRYWDNLNPVQKASLTNNIITLGQEFDSNIYPQETQFWGSEPNPGIDNDPKITIVLEDLALSIGGYFDTSNEYSKNVDSNSNIREMLFVGIEAGSFAKTFLGHEFQHLISYNQKELVRKVQEDVWLNELRSEYSVSLIGYNDTFSGSNLERRVALFLDDPLDSLTEWPNVSLDYSQVAVFADYLVEQYGQSILSETLQGLGGGIASINGYLQNRGFSEKFSDIFESWTIANYLNNNSLDKRYGYQRAELKNIKVTPAQSTLFYPSENNLIYSLKPWQSSWYQYNLSNLPTDKAVKIEYSPNYLVKILYTDNLGRVGILSNPGYIVNPSNLSHIVLMPINEIKTAGFGLSEEPMTVSVKISFVDNKLAQKPPNGSLIKRRGGEKEMYVVEGIYKRYLRPEIIKLYGHLDVNNVIELDDAVFSSYTTANYIRPVNDKKVYAVWPDGTKHWLNMSGEYFTQSGRDWGAIFSVNELESNSYKTGADIIR